MRYEYALSQTDDKRENKGGADCGDDIRRAGVHECAVVNGGGDNALRRDGNAAHGGDSKAGLEPAVFAAQTAKAHQQEHNADQGQNIAEREEVERYHAQRKAGDYEVEGCFSGGNAVYHVVGWKRLEAVLYQAVEPVKFVICHSLHLPKSL